MLLLHVNLQIVSSLPSTSETAALLQNKPLVYPDTIFKLTPRYYENQRQGNYLRDFHQRIIDERREILKSSNNNKSESCDVNGLGYSIFIDHILNNEGMFSDEDIQHHVITVLSAGEDDLHKNASRSMFMESSSWCCRNIWPRESFKFNWHLRSLFIVISFTNQLGRDEVLCGNMKEFPTLTRYCVVHRSTSLIFFVSALSRLRDIRYGRCSKHEFIGPGD